MQANTLSSSELHFRALNISPVKDGARNIEIKAVVAVEAWSRNHTMEWG